MFLDLHTGFAFIQIAEKFCICKMSLSVLLAHKSVYFSHQSFPLRVISLFPIKRFDFSKECVLAQQPLQ